MRWTVIQAHGYISSQSLLNFNGQFRTEEVFTSVNMRSEEDSVFVQIAQPRKAENLIPTAVGENWSVPPHEFVQSPHPFNHLHSWSEAQMIGVAYDGADAKALKLIWS
jgi:hypothetical protein